MARGQCGNLMQKSDGLGGQTYAVLQCLLPEGHLEDHRFCEDCLIECSRPGYNATMSMPSDEDTAKSLSAQINASPPGMLSKVSVDLRTSLPGDSFTVNGTKFTATSDTEPGVGRIWQVETVPVESVSIAGRQGDRIGDQMRSCVICAKSQPVDDFNHSIENHAFVGEWGDGLDLYICDADWPRVLSALMHVSAEQQRYGPSPFWAVLKSQGVAEAQAKPTVAGRMSMLDEMIAEGGIFTPGDYLEVLETGIIPKRDLGLMRRLLEEPGPGIKAWPKNEPLSHLDVDLLCDDE